jgi:hypothetical protein
MTHAISSDPAPVRSFLRDISKDEATHSIRVMGTLVSVLQSAADEMPSVVLDDGTATVVIQTPPHMLNTLRWSIGDTMECIAKLEKQIENAALVLVADTLICVEDVHAAPLRWVELSYRNDPSYDAMGLRWGYPSREMNAEEMFEVIAGSCSDDKSGVSKDDLVSVLQYDVEQIEEWISELQELGQIYQGEDGNYLPL